MKLRNFITFLITSSILIHAKAKKPALGEVDIAELACHAKGKAFAINPKKAKDTYKKLKQAHKNVFWKIYKLYIEPELDYKPLLGYSFEDSFKIVSDWIDKYDQLTLEIYQNNNAKYNAVRALFRQMLLDELRELFGYADLKSHSPFIYVNEESQEQAIKIFARNGKHALNTLEFSKNMALKNKSTDSALNQEGYMVEDYLYKISYKGALRTSKRMINKILCCFVDPNLHGNVNSSQFTVIKSMLRPNLTVYGELDSGLDIPCVMLVRHHDGKLALVKRIGYKSKADVEKRRAVHHYVVVEGNDFNLSTKDESIKFTESLVNRKIKQIFAA